jgi:hypothetical protein
MHWARKPPGMPAKDIKHLSAENGPIKMLQKSK